MADTGPNRAYPSLPAVTGDPRSHTAVLRALREAVEIGERRTGNKLDSFVRLRELVELELLKIVGTDIQVGDGVGSSDSSGSGTDVDSVLTTDGDLLTKLAGVLTRLAAGANGQVLTVAGGAPSWQTPSTGVTAHSALTGLSADDHTQYVLRSILSGDGDLFIRAAGVIARLAVGTTGKYLGVTSSLPAWKTITHSELAALTADDHTQYVLRSILTTNGDIFVRLAGVVDRLGIGSSGQVLTVSGGLPIWANPPDRSSTTWVMEQYVDQELLFPNSNDSNANGWTLKAYL